jgi:hypothetical protein
MAGATLYLCEKSDRSRVYLFKGDVIRLNPGLDRILDRKIGKISAKSEFTFRNTWQRSGNKSTNDSTIAFNSFHITDLDHSATLELMIATTNLQRLAN